MKTSNAIVTGLALMLGACAAEAPQTDGTGTAEQDYKAAPNGLRLSNGLRVSNGMRLANGLRVSNGMRLSNGVEVINGLRTANGLRVSNGLNVDCWGGKVPGTSCTGRADGLLSATEGLLSHDNNVAYDASGDVIYDANGNETFDYTGFETARYMVKCALPNTTGVAMLDWTGTLQSFPGAVGLAPAFADDVCDQGCEERVSACLIALTNGAGAHVNVELSGQFKVNNVNPLGTGHSATNKKQESVMYGNLFSNPPKAFYAVGAGASANNLNVLGTQVFAGAMGITEDISLRLCATGTVDLVTGLVNSLTGTTIPNCASAYVRTGLAGNPGIAGSFFSILQLTPTKCNFGGFFGLGASDTAFECKDTANKTWTNTITVFVP